MPKLKPLQPIYNPEIQYGALDVGSTPGTEPVSASISASGLTIPTNVPAPTVPLGPPTITIATSVLAPTVDVYSPSLDSDLDHWWDFSNTGSLTLSGSDVTAVDDLIGTANLSANGSPVSGTRSQNGLNVLDFQETDELDALGSSMNMDSTGLTLVIVVKSDGSGNDGYCVKNNSNAHGGSWGVYRDTGSLYAIHFTPGTNRYAGVADSNTSPRVIAQRIRRNGASSYNELRINGVQVAVNNFTDGGATYTQSDTVQFGHFEAIAGYRLDGWEGEALLEKSWATDAKLAAREEYLMLKWGI